MKDVQGPKREPFWALGLILALFCAWFVFSLTAPGHHAEDFVRGLLPGWYVAVNLVLVPVLIAVAAAPWRLSFQLRLAVAACSFVSVVLAEIGFRLLLAGSCTMLVVLLIEVYWLIPHWQARHRQAL